MTRIEANPTPAVLKWARTSSGLTPEEASRKLGIALEKLALWEDGLAKPTFAQLRKASTVYKRPLAAFYLAKPPRDFEAMRDFRRHPDSEESPVSSDLKQEIRRAHDRRLWALELMQQLDESPRKVPSILTLSEDVENAAAKLRSFLSVKFTEQGTWKNQALKLWRSKVENAGILTFELTKLPVREARGFSIGLRPLPVAVVNIKDAQPARIFTLLHEVAHILLDLDGICDLHEDNQDRDHASVETFCNRVAGAALFPRDALFSTDVVKHHSRNRGEWSDQELQTLAGLFGGSREAALVRLTNLGLASQPFCDRRREQFRVEYQRLEAEKQARQDSGFAPPHQVALLSAGRLFVQLVVESLNRERITSSDFSDYLQIRAKHIPEVQLEYAGFER